jgi:hypothetical protein
MKESKNIYLLDEINGSHLKEQVFFMEINSSACLRTMHQKGYCGILAPVELEFATGTASKLSSLHIARTVHSIIVLSLLSKTTVTMTNSI